jgi:hypothetical protein
MRIKFVDPRRAKLFSMPFPMSASRQQISDRKIRGDLIDLLRAIFCLVFDSVYSPLALYMRLDRQTCAKSERIS